MQLSRFRNCRVHTLPALCVVLTVCLWASTGISAVVELTPEKDATLYPFDFNSYYPGPENPVPGTETATQDTWPKADGSGYLHVGDTNKNNGVQRGLMQFDLSGIPSNAVVTDVSLKMTVAMDGIPTRMSADPLGVDYWLVAMEDLSQPWSQGPGNDQSSAVTGDTTWFHTQYDPSLHGQIGNYTDNLLQDFTQGDPGYWPAPGYFGDAELLETDPLQREGGLFDDEYALNLPFGVTDGYETDWSNSRMVADVQSWIDGTQQNFGWIMVGEEWYGRDQTVEIIKNGEPTTDRASNKVDFISSETSSIYASAPTLSVTYSVVPEPNMLVLFSIGMATLLLRRIR
ncbi:MAG: PEP-CTERM sorting domain-containing protein [Pirellulales bacterium]|nr:PEP-CTERM sorting domain-containing protein [Pirellulales bacterium]